MTSMVFRGRCDGDVEEECRLLNIENRELAQEMEKLKSDNAMLLRVARSARDYLTKSFLAYGKDRALAEYEALRSALHLYEECCPPLSKFRWVLTRSGKKAHFWEAGFPRAACGAFVGMAPGVPTSPARCLQCLHIVHLSEKNR